MLTSLAVLADQSASLTAARSRLSPAPGTAQAMRELLELPKVAESRLGSRFKELVRWTQRWKLPEASFAKATTATPRRRPGRPRSGHRQTTWQPASGAADDFPVATNLARDGLASPVAIHPTANQLQAEGRMAFRCRWPLIVSRYWRRSARPGRKMITRQGIGDALSNLSALADSGAWELGSSESTSICLTVIWRDCCQTPFCWEGSSVFGGFAVPLAEARVMSGLARCRWPGRSQPCSGALPRDFARDRSTDSPGAPDCHTACRLGLSLRCPASYLCAVTKCWRSRTAACLRRHDLPVTHVDLGHTATMEFSEIVEFALSGGRGRPRSSKL